MKSIKPRILILCEGVCEEFYLKKAKEAVPEKDKRQSISIDIRNSKYSNCESLVAEAVKLKRIAKKSEPAFSSVWVVFDNDRQETKKPGSLSRALNMAHANGIKIVYSSICWEYWYLLHTEYTTRPFVNCDELISHLKTKPGFEDYDKAKGYPKAWEKLFHKLKDASSHAVRLRSEKEKLGEKPHAVNPWVDVDILIQQILES